MYQKDLEDIDSVDQLLYLIDFGISETFLTSRGEHREQVNVEKFTGNMIYSSPTAMKFKCKRSYKDVQVVPEGMTLFQ